MAFTVVKKAEDALREQRAVNSKLRRRIAEERREKRRHVNLGKLLAEALSAK